jgi:hypothetical protein
VRGVYWLNEDIYISVVSGGISEGELSKSDYHLLPTNNYDNFTHIITSTFEVAVVDEKNAIPYGDYGIQDNLDIDSVESFIEEVKQDIKG